MHRAVSSAIGDGPWLLGDTFTMADVIFGGTVAYMLQFKLVEPRPEFVAYVERLAERPARQAAEAKNAAMREEHGLT
jgi:glutathione S-transferase